MGKKKKSLSKLGFNLDWEAKAFDEGGKDPRKTFLSRNE